MGKFDGIFDDVVVNAKAAASVVSKKASDVYGSSKQKILAAEIRGEINKKLRELGALTYKAKTADVDVSKETAAVISEISELKENLDIINKNIASTKNQKKCPNCDAVLPKNSVFCNICGAKLENDVEQAVEDEKASEDVTTEESVDEQPLEETQTEAVSD